MEKKFNIISCINLVDAIGKDGDLLYRISSDLKNFKAMTTDNVVIMGKKTFLSLPNGNPLLDRINVVITTDPHFSVDASFDNVYIVHSIEDAVELCETLFQNLEWFVIGGQSIYQQFLARDLIDTMYLTIVNDNTEGDVHFPNVYKDKNKWKVFYKSYTQRYRPTETTYIFEILKKRYKRE